MELFSSVRSQRDVAAQGVPFRFGDAVGVIQQLPGNSAALHDPLSAADGARIGLERLRGNRYLRVLIGRKVLEGIINAAIPKDAALHRRIQFEIVASGEPEHSGQVKDVVQLPALLCKALCQIAATAGKNPAGISFSIQKRRLIQNPISLKAIPGIHDHGGRHRQGFDIFQRDFLAFRKPRFHMGGTQNIDIGIQAAQVADILRAATDTCGNVRAFRVDIKIDIGDGSKSLGIGNEFTQLRGLVVADASVRQRRGGQHAVFALT